MKTVDLKKLDAYLLTAEDSMKALQDELEGRFSRALVMLDNSRSVMSTHVSKLRAGLVGLQVGTAQLPESATSAKGA